MDSAPLWPQSPSMPRFLTRPGEDFGEIWRAPPTLTGSGRPVRGAPIRRLSVRAAAHHANVRRIPRRCAQKGAKNVGPTPTAASAIDSPRAPGQSLRADLYRRQTSLRPISMSTLIGSGHGSGWRWTGRIQTELTSSTQGARGDRRARRRQRVTRVPRRPSSSQRAAARRGALIASVDGRHPQGPS
jgi:hypothetical protein